MRGRWTIRVRTTLVASVVIGLVCVATSTLATVLVRQLAVERETNEVAAAARHVFNQVERDYVAQPIPAGEVDLIQVVAAQGRVVNSTRRLIGKPPMTTARPTGTEIRADLEVCDSPISPDRCLVVVALRARAPYGDATVYAADPKTRPYVHPVWVLFAAVASMLLTGLAALGTWRAVGRTLASVEAIRAELAEISATDLGRRVPVPAHGGEIARLAETANATLNRLETVVEQQRRFASDASHDLRSPITALRTQLEGALIHPEDTDWPELARANLASVERLQAIVNDLLMLARLDAGADARRRELVDLSEVVTAELDRTPRPRAVTTDLTPGTVVIGDRLRLARLFTNLMDNAERHATSKIWVIVKASGQDAVLEVIDDGAGIDADQREVVFQRFTRLDAARSKDAGGSGLGLAIAREIAAAHGGTLTAEDSPSGARFVLRLPMAPP